MSDGAGAERGAKRDRETERPIFILGIMRRSGTNFLRDLLMLHPGACTPSENIWEPFLLHHSDLLESYVEQVYGRWHRFWDVPERERDALWTQLGAGILGYLAQLGKPGKRLVMKTPSVRNLANFPFLFESCPLLIVVRDGRAVVESGVRTFGWDYEWAMREWAAAARTILAFDRRWRGSKLRYRICRYEDLFLRPAEQVREILGLLELPDDVYDWDGLDALPIRGSSDLRRRGEEVHWKEVERDDEFRPLERWSDWSPWLRRRFEWLAAEEARAFGYELEGPGRPSVAAAARNRWADLRWTGGRVVAFARRNGRAVAGKLRR